MRPYLSALIALALGLTLPTLGTAQQTTAAPGDLERQDGFLPVYRDTLHGRLLLEVPADAGRFLHIVYLATGADGPIRRGMPHWRYAPPNGVAVVRFERSGDRLLLVQEATRFRATGDPELARVVEASSAPSVLAALPILVDGPDTLVVDATGLAVRDAWNVALETRLAGEGVYRFDPGRSGVYWPATGASSGHTEIEALLTFETAEPEGTLGKEYSPDYRAFTVRQRQTLMPLPTAGYQARETDPRLGSWPLEVFDFASERPDQTRRLMMRFDLRKVDHDAALSEPVDPITVYLEAGIPDRYRRALREGVLYWNEALEEAGFRDAVRVEDLPADADPFDPRYDAVMLWMGSPHHSASIGSSIPDPRTGEMIKAIVIQSAMTPLYALDTCAAFRPALGPGEPGCDAFVQARMKFNAAHEFGHVIASLAHNDVAPSVLGARRPGFLPDGNGKLIMDLEQAFPSEPFAYDRWAMAIAYTPFPDGDEEDGLHRMVEDGLSRGLLYAAAWPPTYPRATRRIYGDVLAQLRTAVEVRRIGLAHFGEGVLDPGEARALLFQRLVPVYFHHREEIEAAIRAVGGVRFTYAVAGDGQTPWTPIPADVQRRALAAVLEALEPASLAIPADIASAIAPRSPFLGKFRVALESPGSYRPVAGLEIPASPDQIFDPTAWASALTERIADLLLDPDRLHRLALLHDLDPDQPGPSEVLDQVLRATWGRSDRAARAVPHEAALRRIVREAILDRLLAILEDPEAPDDAHAAVASALEGLNARIDAGWSPDTIPGIELVRAQTRIRRALGL